MTTYTLSDMATRVLRDLGVISAEETPSGVDLTWAEETVSAEIATLAEIGMPIWNGSDVDVPQAYLLPLSNRIGLSIAPSFGLMTLVDAERAKPISDQVLRKLATVPPTGTTQQADYY
jgi:hypothetical protein